VIKINSLTEADTLQYAEAVLTNPVFNAVFYEFRADAIQQWAATSPEQTAQREAIWSEYKAAEKLLTTFQNLVAEIKAAIEQQREAEDGRETFPG
jgi:hypothetical protein